MSSLSANPVGEHCPPDPHYGQIAPVRAAELRGAMRNLASGVAIVATGTGNVRQGSTVSSVTSVCLEPPCLLVCINVASRTHGAILAERCFGISVLRKGQEPLV